MLSSADNANEAVYSIISSLTNDIRYIKTQLESLPPFPKGERPPSPLAKLQNQLEKFESSIAKKADEMSKSATKAPHRASIMGGTMTGSALESEF